MDWKSVGAWVKDNAGAGASLVGSLVAGNVPGAIAAGVSMLSTAAGSDDPDKVLESLQTDPEVLVRLKEIAAKEEDSIRKHLAEMAALELEDKQHEHATTQATVQAGDTATDRFVRWTRPGQSWVSLFAAIAYVYRIDSPDMTILALLLAMPFSYAGLRQIGKGIDAFVCKRPTT